MTAIDPHALAADPTAGRLAEAWREFADNKVAVAALAVVLLLIVAALLAPWITPQNPYDLAQIDVTDGRLPPGSASAAGGPRR